MTATDARESLKKIAIRAHVKTRPANLSVRLVKDNFERRCGFKIDGLRCEVYANPSLLLLMVHRDSGALFSTPRRYPDMGVMLLLGQVAGHDVYVNEQGRGSPVPWIFSSEAIAALSSLELVGEELVMVNLGGLEALLLSAGPDADWQRLQKFAALARILPPGPAEAPPDPQLLPEDLRDLVPLLARWGISDDSERAHRVTTAKSAQLRALVDRVEPKLRQVANFSHEHGADDSAEAFAMDALAQSVMEARQELTNRSKPKA